MLDLELLTREDIEPNAVTVSPSQLTKHWYRCNYRWKLVYLDKLIFPRDEGQRANEGTVFHRLMKAYFQYWIDARQPVGMLPVDALITIQNNELAACKTQAELNAFYHMMGIFNLYNVWWATQEQANPLAAELEVFSPTGLVTPSNEPIYMHGFIDLVAENEWGDVGIVDHKTHEGRPWKEEEVFYDIQLMFYLCILWQQGLDPQWVAINLVNVKEYKREANKGRILDQDRFQRIPIPKDVLRQRGYHAEILRHIGAMYSPNAQYARRLEKTCAYCAYRDHCSAELSGIDGSAILDRFKKTGDDVEMTFDLELDDEGE